MACVHLNWVFLFVFFFLLFCFLKIPKSTTWSAFDILKKTSQNWVSHMCIVDVISLLTRLSCLNVYVCVCVSVWPRCVWPRSLQNEPRPWLGGLTHFSYKHFWKNLKIYLHVSFLDHWDKATHELMILPFPKTLFYLTFCWIKCITFRITLTLRHGISRTTLNI